MQRHANIGMGTVAMIVPIVLLASCSSADKGRVTPADTLTEDTVASPPAVPLTEEEQALARLDAEFEAHIESTALPHGTSGAKLATMAAMHGAQLKAEATTTLAKKYEAFRDAEPSIAAWALFRVAQLRLNLGCEMATFEAHTEGPGGRPMTLHLLARSAEPQLLESTRALEDAAARGGSHGFALQAAEVLAKAADGTTLELCASTEPHWASPGRPKTEQTMPAAIEYVTAWCEGGLYIPPGSGCDAHRRRRCERDDDAGSCAYHAQVLLAARDSIAAARTFQKACDLGDEAACVSVLAIPTARREAEYSKSCGAGDALGCLQLARLRDPKHKVIEACTATAAPTGGTLDQCLAGDRNACWGAASALVAAGRYHLPWSMDSAARPSLRRYEAIPPYDGQPPSRKEMKRACDAGEAYECLGLAFSLAESAKNPNAAFERACELDADNCLDYAMYLLKKRRTVARGVELLVARCAEDQDQACYEAAWLFREGEVVPQSDTCVTALGWTQCTPSGPTGCEELNELVHGPKPP